ncbi:hypothetical protein ASE04_21220 [Rhizobium sp. Root708]|uniref:hypothetical protein n=1 Tax=Rhizobium sp. Root708 TaxID=1736592 RepID=UPI000700FCD0|nr:hypothetical protein [Rhizobium sp. Root708]KRB61389.1 hypothetical protein ASE04_21220 [Rhizobium sp. Root708]
MPNTTVPAAAEGMPLVTQSDVDRSYDLLALLDIAAFAAAHFDGAGENIRDRLDGNLSVVLDVARRWASENHDVIEKMEARQP